VLGTEGDHDLFRFGRQPPRAVPVGDGGAQHRESDRVEARVAEIGRELGGRLERRRSERRDCGQRGLAEVEIAGLMVVDDDR
jgi:hypothetical protein